MIRLLKKKSLGDKLIALEKKLDKNLSKKKIEKVEKLILQYNNTVELIWSTGTSKYPLQRIKSVDEKGSTLMYETGKCEFCGSDDGFIEVIPYLFGTIKFIRLCKKEKCQDDFKDYTERYLKMLSQAHEDLSKYDLSSIK